MEEIEKLKAEIIRLKKVNKKLRLEIKSGRQILSNMFANKHAREYGLDQEV